MGSATLLIAAAAAAGGTPAESLPDIAIEATVRAREVRIEQQGRASASVRVEPSAGESIEVERNLPKGRVRYRNLELKLAVEARLADPRAPAATEPTPATGDDQ